MSRGTRVALTFDVEHPDRPGSSPAATDEILDALAAAGVRATFFLQGRWAEAYPSAAARIAADGHTLGSHSYFHASMPLLSDEGLEADIREAERAILEASGVDPKPWFRCPFGDGADDPRILAALGRLGYRHVSWTIGTSDWAVGRTANDVAETIVAAAVGPSPGVVLLHGWPSITPVALAAAIDSLGRTDVAFTSIDELDEEEIPSVVPADEDGIVPA